MKNVVKAIFSILLVLVVAGCGGNSNRIQNPVHVIEPVCGNSIVEYIEQCDDGNSTDNDGCSAQCKIGFSKTFGKQISDLANSIQQTTDGVFIVAGSTRSYGTGSYHDFWILKLDSEGNCNGCVFE